MSQSFSQAQVVVHDHAFHLIDEALEKGEINSEEALLQKFRYVFDQSKLNQQFLEDDPNHLKCLTPTLEDYYKVKNGLSPSAINEIENYLVPLEQSVQNFARDVLITPSGRFTLTYQTSGSNAVPTEDLDNNNIPDYIDEAIIALDESYDFEINRLGFLDPIPEGLSYSITFQNSFAYGFTASNNGPIETRIVIENDFDGFPPNDDPDGDQLGALRVTIAHELKHAIQQLYNDWTNFGGGGSGDSDDWAEMDATLMEEVVYDQVNDYYNYISDTRFNDPIFQEPQNSLVLGSFKGSYEHITFALYYHEVFGERFWTDVWGEINNDRDLDLLEAVSNITRDQGSSLSRSASEAYLFHLASGSNFSASSYGFDERLNYPNPTITETLTNFTQNPDTSFLLQPFSARFFEFIPDGDLLGSPKIIVDHSDPNIGIAAIGYFEDGSSLQAFGSGTIDGEAELFTGWDVERLERIGIVVLNLNQNNTPSDRVTVSVYVDEDFPTTTQLLQNFPNPFNPSTNIRFRVPTTQNVRIRIFDITGRLVQDLVNDTFEAGDYTVPFNAQGLASGVYIYQLITAGRVDARKMLLIK